MPQVQRRRDDTGAQLVEYAALIVFAVVILGTLTFMLARPVITIPVGKALCGLFSIGGDESGCDPEFRSDEYYEPDRCMVSRNADGTKHSASVVVEGTTGTTFIREEFSDGTVRFIAVDGSSIGGDVGVGGTVGLGPIASASAEANVGLEYGFPESAIWEFDSPEEADQFEQQIRDQAKEDVSKWDFNDFESWADNSGGVPPPTSVRSQHEVDVGANGDLSLSLGNDKKKKDKNKDEGDEDASNQDGSSQDGDEEDEVISVKPTGDWVPNLDPGVDAGVGVSGMTATETHEDGSTSDIYELGGEASFGADWVVDSYNPNIERTGAMKVTRDADGNITEIVITQTTTDSDGPSITTTQLSLENEEQRQIAEEWLGWVPGGQALPITWDDMAPTELPDNADPFQELIFNEGNSMKTTYDQDTSEETIGLQVKIGVSVGYTYTNVDEETTVTSAEYLAAPVDGRREYVQYEDCSVE
ncbi:hypothetical protein [Nocardiopsis rhodophaea]|uniref:hypothetical protein n=1 Tax=Nocardiopsis rhodophaea TaxID=280238 RepID=UPI0031D66DE3